jgi:hypothetical protein
MTNKMTMPAGKYWIGDPCYVFPHKGPMENKWDELLDKVDFSKTFYGELDDGKIKVWAASTAYGDGRYFGSNGKTFPVDAGLIGIVPLETVEYLGKKDADLENCGLFIEFYEPFIVESRDGLFHIGSIVIDTRDDDEYDEEYEYEDYE